MGGRGWLPRGSDRAASAWRATAGGRGDRQRIRCGSQQWVAASEQRARWQRTAQNSSPLQLQASTEAAIFEKRELSQTGPLGAQCGNWTDYA